MLVLMLGHGEGWHRQRKRRGNGQRA